MNVDTDLTLFWLAWQKTCSIRLCCEGYEKDYLAKCASDSELCSEVHAVQNLAKEIISSMNEKFRAYIKYKSGENGLRLSNLNVESASWTKSASLGSAFEVLESHLYAKQKLNGKAFKSYLFEDVGTRAGGINKNLYGYLQRVMRTIIDESFGENVYQPLRNEEGVEVEPPKISLNGTNALNAGYRPDECVEVNEIKVVFSKYLSQKVTWDDDHWLVLFCILNLLRVGSAKIQPLFSKGHQTINVLCSQMKGELLSVLRNGFSDKAIGMALNGSLQEILDGYLKDKPWYGEIKKILEENIKSTGK